jgi:flagellar biosynthesis component FlhA
VRLGGGGALNDTVAVLRDALTAERLSQQTEIQLAAAALVQVLATLGGTGQPEMRAAAMEGVLTALVALQALAQEERDMAVAESDEDDIEEEEEEEEEEVYYPFNDMHKYQICAESMWLHDGGLRCLFLVTHACRSA